MSDETEKPKIEELTLQEFKEQWPKSADGALCSRLLQRYCYSLLVRTAENAECGVMSASAEASAHKTIARMTKDFAGLSTITPKKEPARPMQPLHRFQPENPS